MAVVTRMRAGEAAAATAPTPLPAGAASAPAAAATGSSDEPAPPVFARRRTDADGGVAHRRRWSDALDEAASSGADRFFGVRPKRQQWKSMVGVLSGQAMDTAKVVREALAYFAAPRALAKVVDQAMDNLVQTSLRAQQISRLASGRVWPQKEHVSLDRLVGALVEQRRAGWKARGIEVQVSVQQAEVLSDPSGAGMMVDALLDWAAMRASAFTLAVESSRWPAPACIRLRLAAPQDGAPLRRRRMDDGLHLPLAMQAAAWLDLQVLYQDQGAAAELQVSFPQTYQHDMGLATIELLETPEGQAPARWALVLAADDDLRAEAMHVLSRAGIETRGAATCAEAGRMFEDGSPSVLVFSSEVPDHEFAALAGHPLAEARRCALVEITHGEHAFPDAGFAAWQVPRVGLAVLAKELATTVLFEFARVEAGG